MRTGAWRFMLLAMLLIARPLEASDNANQSGAATTHAFSPLTLPDRATALSILSKDPTLRPGAALSADPVFAADLPDDNSVYAIPPPPKEDEGVNAGGAHFDVDFAYYNRYVYRGVDHSAISSRGNSLNLVLQGRMSFDLGAYPHPFVGVLTNLEENDPVSRFQEIRPFIGVDWNLRPFLLEIGHISYIYSQRETFDTSEVYGKVTLDDSLLLHSRQPLLSPYAMAAYDYQRSNGWYFEVGVKHDFIFDDIGLTLTLESDVGYINHLRQLFLFVNETRETGLQHAEVGLTATYSLNSLLNISKRYGEFDVKGYVFYSDKLTKNITANNVVWAGTGLAFKY